MYCTFWPSALSYACFMRVLPEGTLAVNHVKNVLSGILIGAADKPERGASQRTTLKFLPRDDCSLQNVGRPFKKVSLVRTLLQCTHSHQ